MVITDFLERNARLYGSDIALVEVNPSEERDSAVTWREASLIAEAQPDAPYRRELSWRDFDRRANRFANFLLSRNVRRGTKVGILLMNCLEWLPIYFGILKAGCIAVPLNFLYASDEISYCLDLADVEVLVFGPEFVSRLDPIQAGLTRVRLRLFVGRNVPDYAEDCRRLMGFCSSSVPPIALDEDDDAAIYFSSGTTGFPKAILHRHIALVCSCVTEQHHHGQTKDDVFLCIPPLYHTGAKMHWFGSLISGGKAVLLRGVKPEWILRTVTEEKCTIVWLLVPWAQDILDAIESGRVNLEHYLLDQWRLMHIGAQPVPPSLIKRWLKYFPHHKYDTNYGLSASIGPGCVHLGVDNIEKIGAIGKAGYLWQTRILDERGNDVAPGEIGELAVKGQLPDENAVGQAGGDESAQLHQRGYYRQVEHGAYLAHARRGEVHRDLPVKQFQLQMTQHRADARLALLHGDIRHSYDVERRLTRRDARLNRHHERVQTEKSRAFYLTEHSYSLTSDRQKSAQSCLYHGISRA